MAAGVARALDNNQTLQHLNIDYSNNIDAEGAAAVARTLAANPPLIIIIGVDLGEHLADLLLPEVARQDNEAILAYLRYIRLAGDSKQEGGGGGDDDDDDDTNAVPECQRALAKLCVLGDTDVGKTALVACLRGVEAVDESTDGVDVVPVPDGQRAELGVHDISFLCLEFAGQELYHASHSLVLSERSVLVVMWKPHTTPRDRLLFLLAQVPGLVRHEAHVCVPGRPQTAATMPAASRRCGSFWLAGPCVCLMPTAGSPPRGFARWMRLAIGRRRAC